ncbi:MAG: hypothetical protein ACR2P1_20840 [Pseudomonadales bacterium]
MQRALDALDIYLAGKANEIKQSETQIEEMAWLNGRQRALVAHALRHPNHQYTITSHQRSHNVAYATARADLLQLAKDGLLEQGKTGKKMVFGPGNKLR